MNSEFLDVYDDVLMCPLSVLWLINSLGDGNNSGFAKKFISELISAEIPLYYVDEDFDSKTAFKAYRLTCAEIEEVCMQATCAEYDDSDIITRTTYAEYFDGRVRSSSSLPSDVVPLWFSANVIVAANSNVEMALSKQARIASLFVKLMDVKVKCQLQGISCFHWPNEYPLVTHNQPVVYGLENGLWVRAMPSQSKNQSTDSNGKDALLEKRTICILKILEEKNIILTSGEWNPVSGKRPRSAKIYELVKNDPSFCNHGQPGRGPIAESSFKQLWKERLRLRVLRRIGLPDENW